MKKRKILVLFPLLGLFLSGCTFQEGLAATKSFIGDKIYHPIRDWFNGITGKKEEQKSDTSDEKTLTEVAFKSAPKSVKVGTQLDASLVKLTATYSDKSTAEVSAEKVTVDTSKVATGVKGVAEYKGKTAEFTIDVVDGSTPSGDTEHAGTLEDPYTISDAKVIFDGLEPRGNSQEVYVTGVIAAEPAPKVNASNRGEFYLGDGVCETNLYVYNINDIGGGTFANADKLMVGSTVVAKGAIKKFVSGEDNIFELCYVSNVASCELVSLTPPAGKEIVSLIPGSAVGIPESIVQDEPINLNKITIGVNYQNGSTGTVHPDGIELDSSTPGDNVPGKLFVGSFEYDFTINVTEKVAPSGSIVFPLGDDGAAEHADGSSATEFSETVSGQTISISNGQKMYAGARDATGNGCLKFGTSSAGGSFDLSVSEFDNLEKVIFRVAQYKARNDGTIAIDGGEAYTMQKTSDSGQYDEVEVAITNQTKLSVVFAKRAMLNEIELVFEDTTPVVAVESVEISPSSLELDVSDSPVSLTANVLPVDATDKTVSWHSNDESVVTVSAEGLVTPVGSGSTTIIASAGGVESNACSVTVTTHVTGVSITPTLNLAEGDTGNVVVTVAPANADDPSYTLSSSNTSVAEVNANGVVTAVSAGEATITATTNDGGYTADCVVTVSAVSIPVEDVEVVGDLSRAMVVGDETDLEAHGMPENATEDRSVVWAKASGDSVQITEAGHVTAVAEGVSVVRATSVISESFYADVTITVSKVAVTSVSVKASTTIEVGQTETLTATVLPANATYPTVTWSSSDDSVAEVDQNGVVTAVSAGEATITALADGQSATCVVTVEAAVVPTAIVEPGTYCISAVAENVTYYMKSNGSSSAPTPVTSMDDATQFDFVLVENTTNQYYIKVGSDYLFSTDTNNGIRVGSTQSVWTISEGSIENSNGYDISTVTGSKTRYISLYNTQDWRGYDSATATNRKSNTDVVVPVTSTLESISVTANPTKTSYLVGETFDPSGLEVTAHYELSDNTTKDVVLTSDQYQLSFSGAFAAGDVGQKSITVTFGGKSTSFTVTVDEPTATLVSVTIDGTPKTTYEEGESYSTEGLTATAHYSDNSTLDVTGSAQWSISKATAELNDDPITITASFGGETGQLVVNVTVTEAVAPTPVSYDFTAISDFSSWGNSYSAHDVDYDECTVSFEAASRQTGTITDMPVIKGGKYVNVVAKGTRKITGVSFTFSQWGSKGQTMTLYYSTDGGSSFTSTGISVSDFSALASTSLPAGTNAVQIIGSNTGNQIGIAGVVVTYK